MPDLNDFAKLEPLLARLTEGMMKRAPYASALAIKREGERVSVSSTQSSLSPEPPSTGVVFTAFNGEAFREAATNTLDPAALKKTAEDLADWAAQGLVKGAKPLDAGPELRQSWEQPVGMEPRGWTSKQRMDHAAELQALLARRGGSV